MGVKSSKYYTPDQPVIVATPMENIVKGHPEEYTAKFYKSLSLMVNPSCNAILNGSPIVINSSLGLHITPDNHAPVYELKILDSNVQIFYMGSW